MSIYDGDNYECSDNISWSITLNNYMTYLFSKINTSLFPIRFILPQYNEKYFDKEKNIYHFKQSRQFQIDDCLEIPPGIIIYENNIKMYQSLICHIKSLRSDKCRRIPLSRYSIFFFRS